MQAIVYVEQFIPHTYERHASYISLVLEDLPEDVYTYLKQSVLFVTRLSDGRVSVAGTLNAITTIVRQLPRQHSDLRETILKRCHMASKGKPTEPLRIGHWKLPWHERTLVMGIINVTPDSFSDGGKYVDIDEAVRHARKLVAEGADILDVGGESTRPAGAVYGEGATAVPAEEEKRRVLPLISRLRELNVPISIDTYKAEVAEAALAHGAHIVNDVWGLRKDPNMADVVARAGVPVIIMHNRERINYKGPLMSEIVNDLWESVERARRSGITDKHIILDPGIGFAKTYEQSVQVMHELHTICHMGYPVLLGTSRKSLIGQTLELPVDERIEGTGATVAYGIMKGCSIVRVHDVKEMTRICRMTDTLVKGEKVARG